MDKHQFSSEVERQLRVIFTAIRAGHKPPEMLKHRCEGFMRAGVFMGVVNNVELSDLMEKIHLVVVGMTIQERVAKHKEKWNRELVDYSDFDMSTFERTGR
jgi:hypothetical protein